MKCAQRHAPEQQECCEQRCCLRCFLAEEFKARGGFACEDIYGGVFRVPLRERQKHKNCHGAGEFGDFEIAEQGFGEEGASEDAEGCHGGDAREQGATEVAPDVCGFSDEVLQYLQGGLKGGCLLEGQFDLGCFIQAVFQPCLALKRGLRLLMTYSLPFRRTTWQCRSRFLSVFREEVTFMGVC